MKPTIRHLLSASLFTAVLSSPAMAQSSSAQVNAAIRINAANAMLQEGKIQEALTEYREVNTSEANRDQLNYNMAVAHFRAGDTEAASVLFSDASASGDSDLAARSRYNLGNCFYSDAVKAAQEDKNAAIESIQKAISHYRGSLAGNPNNVDARANIELATEFLKMLQQDQQQDQQQQEQEQQQDQQQQGSQGSNSEQAESSKEQSQQGEQSPQDEQQKESGEQSQSDESGTSDASDQQGQPSESESGDQTSDQADDKQAASQDSPSNETKRERTDDKASQSGDPQGDEKESVIPAGELTTNSEQNTDGEPSGRVAVADADEKDGLMTKEEALKMLQAVRDRDMLRRLRHEQIERSRHVPVDRDW